MKIQDTETKIIFSAFDMRNEHGRINVYNSNRQIIASVPVSRAKLIFNESEIPYMEEVE